MSEALKKKKDKETATIIGNVATAYLSQLYIASQEKNFDCENTQAINLYQQKPLTVMDSIMDI